MRLSLLILPLALFAAGCEAAPKPVASKSGGTVELPPEMDATATAPDPDSAEAAVETLETYFAMIADKNYTAAYQLWGHGGEDSGMTAEAFANSFAKYASYFGEIGTPGNVDAGAGQRWVEVPVIIIGKIKDGSDFRLEGPVILHHVAREIDGASEADKNWHIRDVSGVKPVPNG